MMPIIVEFKPTGLVRLAMRLGGGLMFVSAILWAFFGLPIWAPIKEGDFRVVGIFFFHMAGIGIFVASFWRNEVQRDKDREYRLERALSLADSRLQSMETEINSIKRGLINK